MRSEPISTAQLWPVKKHANLFLLDRSTMLPAVDLATPWAPVSWGLAKHAAWHAVHVACERPVWVGTMQAAESSVQGKGHNQAG